MKLPYGIANFEKIRTENYFYVDKTRYIELLEGMPESCVMILRSRRFGKTLFVNTLWHYYNRFYKDIFDKLFKGTYIHDHPTAGRNKYMVLKFNFSGINTQTIKNANEGFAHEVNTSVRLFLQIYKAFFTADEEARILALVKPNDVINALFKYVSGKDSGRCIYVVIDEYDHFANNLLSQGKEMFKNLVKTDGYVRPFYEALKIGTESVVDRIFITGVMPILLDSLTSGFNIAKNKSTDEKFGILHF